MIIFYWDFQSKRRKITPFITWKKGKGFWWYLNAYNWSNAISQLLKLAPHMKWISFLSMSIQASQKLQRSSKKKKRNEKKNRWIPQQNSKLRQQLKKRLYGDDKAQRPIFWKTRSCNEKTDHKKYYFGG